MGTFAGQHNEKASNIIFCKQRDACRWGRPCQSWCCSAAGAGTGSAARRGCRLMVQSGSPRSPSLTSARGKLRRHLRCSQREGGRANPTASSPAVSRDGSGSKCSGCACRAGQPQATGCYRGVSRWAPGATSALRGKAPARRHRPLPPGRSAGAEEAALRLRLEGIAASPR